MGNILRLKREYSTRHQTLKLVLRPLDGEMEEMFPLVHGESLSSNSHMFPHMKSPSSTEGLELGWGKGIRETLEMAVMPNYFEDTQGGISAIQVESS